VEKNGYISKTIICGQATVTIHRPVLTDAERKKKVKHITESLGHSLRDYLKK
jgi:hypothetical protein